MITISLFVALLITAAVLAYLIIKEYRFSKKTQTQEEEAQAFLTALFGTDKNKK